MIARVGPGCDPRRATIAGWCTCLASALPGSRARQRAAPSCSARDACSVSSLIAAVSRLRASSTPTPTAISRCAPWSRVPWSPGRSSTRPGPTPRWRRLRARHRPHNRRRPGPPVQRSQRHYLPGVPCRDPPRGRLVRAHPGAGPALDAPCDRARPRLVRLSPRWPRKPRNPGAWRPWDHRIGGRVDDASWKLCGPMYPPVSSVAFCCS